LDAIDPDPKPKHTVSGILLGTAAILLALGLVWAGTIMVRWYLDVREARQCLGRFWVRKIVMTARFEGGEAHKYIRFREDVVGSRPNEYCEDLGGKTAAARKVGAYLARPGESFPKRREAIFILSGCGRAGVRSIISQLSNEDAEVRCAAACALGEIGAEAEEAEPNLELLLNDPDGDTRIATKSAIDYIRWEVGNRRK